MSGYLQRLVERTLNAEAVVQPLIASRFSRAPAIGGEFAEERQPVEAAPAAPPKDLKSTAIGDGQLSRLQPTETGLAEDTMPVEAGSASSGDERLPSVQPAGMPDEEPNRPSPHTTLTAVGMLEVTAEHTTSTEDAPGEESIAKKHRKNRTMLSESTPAAVVSASTGALGTDHGREPSTPPVAQQARTGVAGIDSAETQSHAASVRSGDLLPRDADNPLRMLDLSLPAVSRLTRDEQPASSPTLPSIEDLSLQADLQTQPVIRVTIGRIEVRAVPSAAPAPRASAPNPAPALTLQEYLQQRNGSGR